MNSITNWANRLAQLTLIDIEEAKNIANLRIKSHNSSLKKMKSNLKNKFNYIPYATAMHWKRQIIQKESINPLCFIKDEIHAQRVIKAHYRHNNTNYDKIIRNLKKNDKYLSNKEARTKARELAYS